MKTTLMNHKNTLYETWTTFAFLCQYVCHLYDQPAADNVNEARYKAFCMTSSALPELSIPPTTDALHQHCKRANYQAAIMRSCLKQNISAPSPAGYGWQIEDGNLHVTWMTRNLAPTVFCMWYTVAAKVPVRPTDVPVFLQDCVAQTYVAAVVVPTQKNLRNCWQWALIMTTAA